MRFCKSANIERFPQEFCFQLTKEEAETIASKSQFVTLNIRGNLRGTNIKKLPYAFTEQGIAMLSAVRQSEIAVKISIVILPYTKNITIVTSTPKGHISIVEIHYPWVTFISRGRQIIGAVKFYSTNISYFINFI